MPFLAALIGNAFSGLVAFLAMTVTRRVAVGLALGIFFVGGWIALQVAARALWIGLGFVAPERLVHALALALYILPSNTVPCIQALVAARVVIFIWQRQRELAKVVSFYSP